jgi:hypothetical protein
MLSIQTILLIVAKLTILTNEISEALLASEIGNLWGEAIARAS